VSTRYAVTGPDEAAAGVEVEHSGRDFSLAITIPVDPLVGTGSFLLTPVSPDTRGQVRWWLGVPWHRRCPERCLGRVVPR
jgi:hypothetical protein